MHRDVGVPQTGKHGRPLIQIGDKGLSSRQEAVTTIYHEVYHHDQRHRLYDDQENEAEAYGRLMWSIFVQKARWR